MYSKISVVVIITICLFSSGCTITREYDEVTVQGFLNKIFPISEELSKSKSFLKSIIGKYIIKDLRISLTEPVVNLEEGSDRIGCKITGEIYYKKTKEKEAVERKIDIPFSTTMRYDNENYSFYLKDLRIDSIDDSDILKSIPNIGKILQKLISDKIDKIPVYKIKDDTFMKRMARRHVDEIKLKVDESKKLIVIIKF